MGLDYGSFILALDADSVRAIRADVELWSAVEDYPPFGPQLGDETFPAFSYRLLDEVPIGDGWIEHFGDRSFRQAEYLLDPVTYLETTSWEQRERTTAYQMIFGQEPFAHEGMQPGRCNWRCSRSAWLATTAQRIDTLGVAAARRNFSVAQMLDQGVYKVHPEDVGHDDERFAQILANLREFAEHCRRVADQGLDLVIKLV
ncbi:DUF1877 family protein [Actinoplanes sp. M2I2]|uniref:DUF1877 family protein n=1 Tax=Actinoplanes sp. M2I2 TaxID=1734444 RepID=UPI0020203CD3|nr:DUF1877 family protein [Actinoplanes sp. M2I2]